MIIVLGSVTTSQGHLVEALALSHEHVARSRGEPGCLSHAVHQDTENPQRLVFVEQWADQAALTQHFQVPASRAFVKALSALAIDPPKLEMYEVAKVQG
jgi:quinol monooxygenase YgiN